jgi:3'-phosphoadenosine 5'-phosphosulfate (PAPS) 3'-phosphatase
MEQIYGMATPEADYNFYEFPDEIFEEDMVIWIDPIDGTKGFTEGHMTHITCLIGVAVNGRPRIGVVHKPFYKQGIAQGRTYFGTPECGIFIKDKFPRQVKRLQRITPLMPFHTEDAIERDDYKMWVVGSMNRNQQSMNEIINAL